MIKTVAIAGVGLIGGSFALALRKAGFTGEIVGVDFPAVVATAVASGIVSAGKTLEQAAHQADLLYLAQPIDQILISLELLGPLVRPGTLVTDAGSTKALIQAAADEHIVPGCFLGGHPMAGKELRGCAHADANLFRGRPYVLTSTGAETDPTREFRSWLKASGAQIVEMTPMQHDQTVAFTSHLPQLLSTVLSALIADSNNADALRVFGPGLLDMTRLALSAPEVWLSVLRTNKAPIQLALRDFRNELLELEQALDTGRLEGFFERGASFSRELRSALKVKEST